MTDQGAPAPATESAPASSLAPAAAFDKEVIESWMGDPSSPYWRGNDHHSAAEVQQLYTRLTRGELAGEAGPVSAPWDPAGDLDVPADPGGYSLTGLPIFNSEDRDIVDRFLITAHTGNLGQTKVRDAIEFALVEAEPTPAAFERWAMARGWSDRDIAWCLAWHRAEMEHRYGD